MHNSVDQTMRVSVCGSNFNGHAEEDGEENILTLLTPLLLTLLTQSFEVLAHQISYNVR
jgi:hypothetical protein